jgi:hypothetical protein
MTHLRGARISELTVEENARRFRIQPPLFSQKIHFRDDLPGS